MAARSIFATKRRRESLPKYRVHPFQTAEEVAKAYRRYAREKIKDARNEEGFIERLLTGNTSREPWLKKQSRSSSLVQKYLRKAAAYRRLAKQALDAANAAERLIPSPRKIARAKELYDQAYELVLQGKPNQGADLYLIAADAFEEAGGQRNLEEADRLRKVSDNVRMLPAFSRRDPPPSSRRKVHQIRELKSRSGAARGIQRPIGAGYILAAYPYPFGKRPVAWHVYHVRNPNEWFAAGEANSFDDAIDAADRRFGVNPRSFTSGRDPPQPSRWGSTPNPTRPKKRDRMRRSS